MMGCKCSKDTIRVKNAKYFICERIADGGFGVIDLVEDKHGRNFALKRIKCSTREDAHKAAIEIEYLKRFNNPNIIKLVNNDITEDHVHSIYYVHLVMPYFHNGTLQDEIDRCIKNFTFISDEMVAQIMFGVCNALVDIHREKLSHRDLKPQNILISDNKKSSILTDFGSMSDSYIAINNSRKAQEIQDWASENCSMFYKAPELFSPQDHKEITEAGDIWSFGCNLYAALYGKGPFDYVLEHGDSIALAVCNTKYTLPNRHTRNEKLVNIIKKTIVLNPKERLSLANVKIELNELASH